MTLRKEIHEAAIIPTGYGLAWWEWNRPIAICYPIPLNVIVSLARRFWLALKHFGKQDREMAAYQAGMDARQLSHEIQLNFIRDQHAEKELAISLCGP